jgi:hypothetical protein
MADFYQKITEMQGTLEDIVRKIPGFSGYLEKDDRRAADRLLRDQVSRRFEELLTEFTRVQQQVVEKTGLQYMERVQGIDTKLRTFIDRIESAAQGYAGVFDSIKIKEEGLARLYAFDNALLTYQDQFAQGVARLEQSLDGGEVTPVLNQLDQIAIEANNTFLRRVEALQGLQEGV